MSNFDINVDRRTDGLKDGRTDGRKSDAYIAPCYKQVRQKADDKCRLNLAPKELKKERHIFTCIDLKGSIVGFGIESAFPLDGCGSLLVVPSALSFALSRPIKLSGCGLNVIPR